jgi:hypothetical protein
VELLILLDPSMNLLSLQFLQYASVTLCCRVSLRTAIGGTILDSDS